MALGDNEVKREFAYRIRGWSSHFETSESRKRKGPLAWVGVATKHDGRGFTRLAREPDFPALYGAWVLICAVAAKCPVRGTLADEDGPMTALDIADKTKLPEHLVQRCFDVLSDPEKRINWLERVFDYAGACCDLLEPAGVPADTSPTGHNRTEQDRTSHVGSEFVSECSNVEKQPAKATAATSSGKRPSIFSELTSQNVVDVPFLMGWFNRASNAKNPLFPNTDADRLNVIAASFVARRRGNDVLKYFISLVRGKTWSAITEADETAAEQAIKAFLHGPPRRRSGHGGVRSVADGMRQLTANLAGGA